MAKQIAFVAMLAAFTLGACESPGPRHTPVLSSSL